MEQQELYEVVKNNLPIGFTLVDQDGIILDFNPQAEAMTGYLKPVLYLHMLFRRSSRQLKLRQL